MYIAFGARMPHIHEKYACATLLFSMAPWFPCNKNTSRLGSPLALVPCYIWNQYVYMSIIGSAMPAQCQKLILCHAMPFFLACDRWEMQLHSQDLSSSWAGRRETLGMRLWEMLEMCVLTLFAMQTCEAHERTWCLQLTSLFCKFCKFCQLKYI